jgi:hypothetical protein
LPYISKFKRDKGVELGCREGRRVDQVRYKRTLAAIFYYFLKTILFIIFNSPFEQNVVAVIL